MSINSDDFDDSLSANTLKEGMVIVTDIGNKDYVKITKVSKVKNGKHGAAKIMITGKNVRTNNKAEVTFTGSSKIPIILPVKTTYNLIDLDEEEDCLYVEPVTMMGHGEMITLHLNQIEKTGVELIKTSSKLLQSKDDILSFITMEYPGLILIDSVKTANKDSANTKRS